MPSYPDPRDPRRTGQAPAQSRRRKKRRRRLHVPGIVLVLFLVGGLLFLRGRFVRSHSLDTPPHASYSEQGEAEAVGDGLQTQLQELAREEPRARDILSHLEDYPQELLELAVRNPETVDFVANYPQEKDRAPAETVEEAERGTIPLLLQWDPRWGCAQYGDGPMALNGCGPTALSMVICGLTGDDTITPYTVAQYADSQGLYVDGVGTSWDLMRTRAEHFGLTAKELPLDEGVVTRALKNGQPIICSVGPGDFTTSGHFIVLVGMEDGKIRVNDPNRHSTSSQLWDYDTLAEQINNLWAYSLA